MRPISNKKPVEITADEAAAMIKSNSRVFLHGACATPIELEAAMCRREDLRNVRVYHQHTNSTAPYAAPEMAERFRSVSLFAGSNVRPAIQEGRADCIPIFLSEIPQLFLKGIIHLDVALVSLSEPNSKGFCTLGTSVDSALSAVQTADIVIAEINKQMPATYGQSMVHLSQIDYFVKTDRPLCYLNHGRGGPAEEKIGEIVSGLIEDGSTLQMGIGAIPGEILAKLGNKHDLGVHTEMFSDTLVSVVESGVINGARNNLHPNRIITAFVSGGPKVVEFVRDNPQVEFYPINYTNDPAVISQINNMIAINSAIEVDLTGQVCADSIGPKIYSGFGGQVDFIRGAALSKGGKSIIALPSTAKKGEISRIVPMLKEGAGVVTTRAHIHWVVTEYGAVDIFGKDLRERADALISIAHPDFRGELRNAVKELRHFTF